MNCNRGEKRSNLRRKMANILFAGEASWSSPASQECGLGSFSQVIDSPPSLLGFSLCLLLPLFLALFPLLSCNSHQQIHISFVLLKQSKLLATIKLWETMNGCHLTW